LSATNNSKKKLSDSAYFKYSGLAFQLVAAVLLGFFAGRWLDKILKLNIPVFTLLLSCTAVVLSLYQLVKDFSSKKHD